MENFDLRIIHVLMLFFLSYLQKAIVNRPALGVFPGADWPVKLRSTLMSVSLFYIDSCSDIIWPCQGTHNINSKDLAKK